MEKIFSYIEGGKGRGLLFLLAAAVLMTTISVFFLKRAFSEIEPVLLTAAEDVLPITLQNGKITNPLGVYKKVDLRFSNDDDADVFPVILDTREENSSVPDGGNGVYIMRDKLYLVTPQKIENVTLADGVYDVEAFKKTMNYFMGAFSLVMSLMLIVVYFVVFLLKTLLVALCGKIFSKKDADKGNYDKFMRLGAVIVACLEVVSYAVSFGLQSLHLNGVQLLIAECLLAVLYLFYSNKTEAENK